MKATELPELLLCQDCVEDPHLSNQIRKHGNIQVCSYCGQKDHCFTLDKMANRVETAFNNHYEKTNNQPTEEEYLRQNADPDSTYSWYREGESLPFILEDVGGIPTNAAQDIQRILENRHSDPGEAEEQDFDREALYDQKGVSDAKWQQNWDDFERIVKTESRFFSKKVSEYLSEIFSGLDQFRSYHKKKHACKAGPKEELCGLYRARVFQDREEMLVALKHPDQQIGTPSSRCARGGRMNASGVAVFYGATSEALAMAEVRPPVGSKVVIAYFEITRNLRLLDLTELRKVVARGSIFDPKYASAQEKALFLRRLAERIALPVMPAQEGFEYLPTQIIADFLAEGLEQPYDGIIFSSTQSKAEGNNVVLFHRAARVQPIELLEGSEITAHQAVFEPSEGEYESYNVVVQKPGRPHKKKEIRDHIYHHTFGFLPSPRKYIREDTRKITLKIQEEVMRIFEVEVAEFSKKNLTYRRTTIKKQGREKKRNDRLDF